MRSLRWGAAALMLALVSGCGIGAIKNEKRDGNYLVVVDLPIVSIADVGYAGTKPAVRSVDSGQWAITATVGNSIAEVISDRAQGKSAFVDDAEIPVRLSYEKILLLRKLDEDDAEFIKSKYASHSPDYLVLVTKSRLGMAELYGVGMRQKDIPMADFRCQFFAAIQLDVLELSTGKIVSTVKESQNADCPSPKYFQSVDKIDDKALAQIRDGVTQISAKTANKIARHLLMNEAEAKDEFKLRLPGFE